MQIMLLTGDWLAGSLYFIWEVHPRVYLFLLAFSGDVCYHSKMHEFYFWNLGEYYGR